jgi:hypothetical protein
MSYRNEEFINGLVDLIRNDVIQSEWFIYLNGQISVINNIDTYNIQQTNEHIKYLFNFEKVEVNEQNLQEIKTKIKEHEKRQFFIEVNNLDEIKKLNTTNYFYSAYPNNMDSNDFGEKQIVWFTERMDQAILHPLDTKEILNPIMFRFKLLENYICIFDSSDKDNIKIFETISSNIRRKLVDYVNTTKKTVEFTSKNIFIGNNNKYILYVIEAINRIFACDFFKISGYKNHYDQSEIALINFNTLVDKSSLIKYIYTKIKYDGVETIFPLQKPQDIRQIYDTPGFYKGFFLINRDIYEDKLRMDCSKTNMQIYYKEEGKDLEEVFDCSTISSIDSYRKKYMKYKQKYLQLKNKIN